MAGRLIFLGVGIVIGGFILMGATDASSAFLAGVFATGGLLSLIGTIIFFWPKSNHDRPMIIAVHDGVFHLDDVVAIALLKLLYDKITIVRTRDEAKLKAADLVIDVGGRYDGVKWFDHHQKDRPLRKNGKPYAAASLIWKHFGERILVKHLPESTDLVRAAVLDSLDRRIFMPIDIPDNGLAQSGPDHWLEAFDIFDAFNPPHGTNEPGVFDGYFGVATIFAYLWLQRVIRKEGKRQAALPQLRSFINPKNHVVLLPQEIDWQLEIVENHPHVWFVVGPRTNGLWGIVGVNTSPASQQLRKKLPARWLKKRPEGCTFVHQTRFFAEVETLSRALELVNQAVQLAKRSNREKARNTKTPKKKAAKAHVSGRAARSRRTVAERTRVPKRLPRSAQRKRIRTTHASRLARRRK